MRLLWLRSQTSDEGTSEINNSDDRHHVKNHSRHAVSNTPYLSHQTKATSYTILSHRWGSDAGSCDEEPERPDETCSSWRTTRQYGSVGITVLCAGGLSFCDRNENRIDMFRELYRWTGWAGWTRRWIHQEMEDDFNHEWLLDTEKNGWLIVVLWTTYAVAMLGVTNGPRHHRHKGSILLLVIMLTSLICAIASSREYFLKDLLFHFLPISVLLGHCVSIYLAEGNLTKRCSSRPQDESPFGT